MEQTHVLVLAHTPRPTFMQDMTAEERAIMGRHLAFLQGLLTEDKLLLAGPCLDGSYGVAMYKVTSMDEARELLARDPAVVEGLFQKVDLHPIRVGLLATS